MGHFFGVVLALWRKLRFYLFVCRGIFDCLVVSDMATMATIKITAISTGVFDVNMWDVFVVCDSIFIWVVVSIGMVIMISGFIFGLLDSFGAVDAM